MGKMRIATAVVMAVYMAVMSGEYLLKCALFAMAVVMEESNLHIVPTHVVLQNRLATVRVVWGLVYWKTATVRVKCALFAMAVMREETILRVVPTHVDLSILILILLLDLQGLDARLHGF